MPEFRRSCAVALLLLMVVVHEPVGRAEEPAPQAAPLTFEAVPVSSDELPAGTRIVTGLRCVSQAANEFYIDPGFAGSLDAPPVRKSVQSFERADGGSGSVLLFEYAGAVPTFMQRVLARALWGDGGRCAATPDEVVVQGKLLWVFSFRYGDPTAEWVKDRLRKRFLVPAPRTRPGHTTAEAAIWRLMKSGNAKSLIAALDASGLDLADWSLGSYFRGEFAAMSNDWPAAETAYRRAVDLHRTLTDPLPDNLAWAAQDGVGNALLGQKKYDAAAAVLTRSKAEGRALRLTHDDTPHTAYALACALAQLGKWDDALRELADAVDGDPRWFKLALTDELLAAARKRPEFRVLLELDPPPRAPLPPKPSAPAKPTEPVTFDALLMKAADLPAGWALVDGPQCVSTSAATFLVTQDPMKIAGRSAGPRPPSDRQSPAAPMPVRKACQSIVRPDGSAGSVLLFEYREAVDQGIAGFLRGYFWGEDGGPTDRYPEEILTSGRYLFVFSFPRGDASGEWVKERLRKRFRIVAPRTRLDLVPVMKRVFAAAKAEDAALGLRILDARASKLADCAIAWFFRGEFSAGKADPTAAEIAYRRAIELHDALVDPLPDAMVWAALDGQGMALMQRKKCAEALPVLDRAKAFASEHGIANASQSNYNRACALALLKRYDESIAELKVAIAARASWKDQARDDADFAEARKRPDFQALLAK